MFRSPFAAQRLGCASRRYFKPRFEILEDRLTPSDYSLTPLGVIGTPQAINNSGLVGITVGDSLGFANIQISLYNTNTNQATSLPALPPNGFGTFNTTSLIGINDSNQVFVDAYSNEYDVPQAFRYNSPSDSTPTQLGPITSQGLPALGVVGPVAANNSGQVLYNFRSSFSNGFFPELYEPGRGFQLLYQNGLPSGYSNVEALGLNNSGQILVNATTTAGVSEIVLLDSNGAVTPLTLNPLSFNKDFANGVLNNSGQAVINPVDGSGVHHVDFYNGTWTNLNNSLLPGYSDPLLVGMNDAGQILADATFGSGANAVSRPLLYSNGQWSDLNNLIPSGGTVTLSGIGGAINNNGQIVAGDAAGNAYLLTPQQGVTQQETHTSLLAEPANVPAGQSVTLTATVSNVAPGSGAPPGGNVTFFNGSTTLETVPLTNGTAILPATLPAGADIITATYNGVTQGNTVYNSSTSTPVTVTVTVQTAPAITSGNSASFTVGQGGNFTVTTTGSPTPTVTESGPLPPGLAFIINGDGTATLTGAPIEGAEGTYYFTIAADNGVGSANQNFALTVNPASAPPSSPSAPPSAPSSPPAPPSLNVPSLLALFDSLLGGTETVNADGTETIADFLFGIPLMVSTFDHSGNLVSVTMFGINVTFLFA